jgi:clan AA aspartic protease (TIGR02281 family)
MSRRLLALTIVLLLLAPLAARGDDSVPDERTIRANIAAATGPQPKAWHERYESVGRGGSTYVEQVAHRGEDYRARYDDGPFHSEEGSSRGQDWHQNDNGQTVLDEADPQAPIPIATTTTVSRVHSPVEAYVIATLDARHSGTKEYVDPTTWHIVRRERLSSNGTTTTVYDDFRLDHGRTFAHHWHVEDGRSQTAWDTRVTAYDDGPVTDDDVAIATPRRALIAFPPGVQSVALPTAFHQDKISVRVTINGRGLDFALDTGADEITIDSTVAKQLGLSAYDPHSAVTAGRYTTARTIVPEMHVGDLVMRNVAVQVVPQGWQTADGVKEVGLLGFDFLAELGVTIDYEHEHVTAVRGEDYVPPKEPDTFPLDVRIGSGSPLTSVKLNGVSDDRWTIDTGASGTFLIFDYFARRHPEALRDYQAGGARSEPVQFYGIGGNFETRPYEIQSVELGNVRFRDFVGYRVMSDQSYSYNSDGVIGSTFLRLFTLGLDYGNSRVYLVPNGAARKAFTR